LLIDHGDFYDTVRLTFVQRYSMQRAAWITNLCGEYDWHIRTVALYTPTFRRSSRAAIKRPAISIVVTDTGWISHYFYSTAYRSNAAESTSMDTS